MAESTENKKDLHFKGQYADEQVEAFFRAHWITLVPGIIAHFFFLIVIAVVFGNFSSEIAAFFRTSIGEIVLILSVFLLTYFIHNFFIKLINHFLNTVILTNLRIVEIQKMIFVKDLQISLDLRMVQDVKKLQNGILENVVNFGELIFMMSSSDVRVIKFVPNPNFHFRLINRVKLEAVQKRIGDKNNTRSHQSILFENFTSNVTKEQHLDA